MTVSEASRVLYEEYARQVRNAAELVISDSQEEGADEPSECLDRIAENFQTYCSANRICLFATCNLNAYENEMGETPENDMVRAVWAFRADVAEYLEEHHDGWQTPFRDCHGNALSYGETCPCGCQAGAPEKGEA